MHEKSQACSKCSVNALPYVFGHWKEDRRDHVSVLGGSLRATASFFCSLVLWDSTIRKLRLGQPVISGTGDRWNKFGL